MNHLFFTHQGANWVNNMPENFRTEYPASVQEYITKQSKMNLNVVDLISDAKVETVGEEFFESLFSKAVEIAEKKRSALLRRIWSYKSCRSRKYY